VSWNAGALERRAGCRAARESGIKCATLSQTVTESGGERACLIEKAMDSAEHNNLSAFELTVICQCRNDEARMGLGAAGQSAVCDY
jgi:hypothetical protein